MKIIGANTCDYAALIAAIEEVASPDSPSRAAHTMTSSDRSTCEKLKNQA
jgi:hypothetical protein